jgi:hypothetical protein
MEVGNPLLKDEDLAEVYKKIEAMQEGEIRSLMELPEEKRKIFILCIKFRIRFIGDCELNKDQSKIRKLMKFNV